MKKKAIIVLVCALVILTVIFGCIFISRYKKVYDIERTFGVNITKNDIINYQKSGELFAAEILMDEQDVTAFLQSHNDSIVKKPNIVDDLLISWGLDVNKCDSIVELCVANNSSGKKSINISYFFIRKGNQYTVFCSCI